MKFDAAATMPGFANCSQKGTEPSAKSIQTGFVGGSAQASPVAASGAPGRAEAVRPATASSRSRETLFTRPTLSSRKKGGATVAAPPLYVLALVERGVDLRDLLGLSLFLRRVLLAVVRSTAEIESEAREARAVAAVAADLLECGEESFALVR